MLRPPFTPPGAEAPGRDRLEDDECADEQEQAELQEEADGQAQKEERNGEQQPNDGQGRSRTPERGLRDPRDVRTQAVQRLAHTPWP